MNIRAEIALHPEIVKDTEALIKKIADLGAGLAETAIVGAVPMGVFLRPLVVSLGGYAEGKALGWIDHALDGLTQAQPTVIAGDGHAGLISIEEIPTPRSK